MLIRNQLTVNFKQGIFYINSNQYHSFNSLTFGVHHKPFISFNYNSFFSLLSRIIKLFLIIKNLSFCKNINLALSNISNEILISTCSFMSYQAKAIALDYGIEGGRSRDPLAKQSQLLLIYLRSFSLTLNSMLLSERDIHLHLTHDRRMLRYRILV